MKNLTLRNIAKACNGSLYGKISTDYEVCPNKEKEVSGVVLDSRLVEKDFLFIATRGEYVDGHDYIKSAFKKGALAVVCEKAPTNTDMPFILVNDSFIALKKIAKWYRMQLDIMVVGITGSVGKTSTKEYISSVLSKKYNVLKTEGNYNNEVGLPLTILKIRAEHNVAVLEMGINHFGEMHRLSEMAKPNICLLTNIGQSHLENLGSRKGILKAKSEMFDFIKNDSIIIVNGDDDMLSTIDNVNGIRPISFGTNNYDLKSTYNIYANNIKTHGLRGTTCDIYINRVSSENNDNHITFFNTTISLPGRHMIYNALAAVSVGMVLGLNDEDIALGIEAVKPIKGRNNIIHTKNLTIIDDCYNANPVSMKAALDLLNLADTRKVAILGDMGELGDTENALHKEVGSYASSEDLDLIICVGKLSRSIYEGALEKLYSTNSDYLDDISMTDKLMYYETRDELISNLSSVIIENDTVLVKASHSMGFDNVVNALLYDVFSHNK